MKFLLIRSIQYGRVKITPPPKEKQFIFKLTSLCFYNLSDQQKEKSQFHVEQQT